MATARVLGPVGLAILLSGWAPPRTIADRGVSDWPQWRGPRRDGVSTETGLLQKWPAAGPPLAWKTSGLGKGFSSVAVSGGALFTMGRRKGAQVLLSLDLRDGRERWSSVVREKGSEEPHSTPTTDGERVYAIGPAGDLVCVSADSGKELWRRSFTADFGGAQPGWNYCESPLVDGEWVLCTPGGTSSTLVALDRKTGQVVWKCAVPGGPGNGFGYSSIVVSEGGGVRQYVQMMGQGTGAVGVAAKDGTFLWKYPRVGNGTATIPTAVVDGDFVFCSSGYNTGSGLLRLSRDGEKVKAEEVYFIKGNRLQNHHGGWVKVGDYIYGGHGHNQGYPVCVEMKTGRIVWGGDGPGPGKKSAAVVYADGQLYFRYEDGVMALLAASKDGLRVNGAFLIPQVAGPSWSHPVVTGGILYLREEDTLFAYDVQAR
ncbi:MAG TPA: PQQ-binding-like beta-propeller repeat protein [Planctomycetota bacterium]|nr:PQQ-binding-like beta-propeller repeat protein [Planctomycetota bacterium]